jgi:C-terminal processing protease CtpA/Prc
MLINEYAMSASEHTSLRFEAAADVTFIGSPTSGANGMITSVVLPGGMFVTFTGADVRHADGRQLQRVGIQPHIRVEPTLAGLRAGRDEVLEARSPISTRDGREVQATRAGSPNSPPRSCGEGLGVGRSPPISATGGLSMGSAESPTPGPSP